MLKILARSGGGCKISPSMSEHLLEGERHPFGERLRDLKALCPLAINQILAKQEILPRGKGVSTPKCNEEDAMTRNYVGNNLFTSDRDGSSDESPSRDVYTDPLHDNPVLSTAVKVDGLKYNTKTGKLEKDD